MHTVQGKDDVGTKREDLREHCEISGSTVSTARNRGGSSWLLQSTGAPCATDRAAARTDGGDSTERPPRGSRTKWEFSFEDWS